MKLKNLTFKLFPFFIYAFIGFGIFLVCNQTFNIFSFKEFWYSIHWPHILLMIAIGMFFWGPFYIFFPRLIPRKNFEDFEAIPTYFNQSLKEDDISILSIAVISYGLAFIIFTFIFFKTLENSDFFSNLTVVIIFTSFTFNHLLTIGYLVNKLEKPLHNKSFIYKFFISIAKTFFKIVEKIKLIKNQENSIKDIKEIYYLSDIVLLIVLAGFIIFTKEVNNFEFSISLLLPLSLLVGDFFLYHFVEKTEKKTK
jgi:hypothetical protein